MDRQSIGLIAELDFEMVLRRASEFCQSLAGKKLLQNASLSFEPKDIRKKLTETLEAVDILSCETWKDELDIGKLPEDTSFAFKIKSGKVPELEELNALRDFLRCNESTLCLKGRLKRTKYTELADLLARLNRLDELRDRFSAIFTEDCEVKDSASAHLRSLRATLCDIQLETEERIQRMMRMRLKGKDAEAHISIRNNRLTVNIPTGMLHLFPGLIIDYSLTGASVYVEPKEVVELNNERQKLLLEEEIEVRRILTEFIEFAKPYALEIIENHSVIAELDAILARASYSNEIEGILPELSEEGEIILVGARHPLMASFVPEDLEFRSERGLVISGVNAGGKTVLLKLIGLFSLMTYYGFLIPVREGTTIGLFDSIFVDISDEQSFLNNLSTFTSRLNFLKETINFLETKGSDRLTLILIDELEAGTDPGEGAALGTAILEFLLEKPVKVAVTTHHDTVKAFGVAHKDCKIVSLEFDEKSFKPTFRILDGIPGKSFAFEIALSSGISEDIIERGRNALGETNKVFSEALKEINSKKEELEEQTTKRRMEISEIEELKCQLQAAKDRLTLREKELQRAFENLKTEFYAKVDEFLTSAEGTLHKIITEQRKTLMQKDIRRLTEEIEKKAEETLTKIAETSPIQSDLDDSERSELRVGAKIELPAVGIKGEVEAIDEKKNRVTILSQRKRITLSLKKVKNILHKELISATEENIGKGQASQAMKEDKTKLGKSLDMVIDGKIVDTAYRLDLHGFNREEALFKVENFISQAIYQNLEVVHILHGIGSGTLRKFVREYLGRCEYVKSFRDGTSEEGGRGVTVVYLK